MMWHLYQRVRHFPIRIFQFSIEITASTRGQNIRIDKFSNLYTLTHWSGCSLKNECFQFNSYKFVWRLCASTAKYHHQKIAYYFDVLSISVTRKWDIMSVLVVLYKLTTTCNNYSYPFDWKIHFGWCDAERNRLFFNFLCARYDVSHHEICIRNSL